MPGRRCHARGARLSRRRPSTWRSGPRCRRSRRKSGTWSGPISARHRHRRDVYRSEPARPRRLVSVIGSQDADPTGRSRSWCRQRRWRCSPNRVLSLDEIDYFVHGTTIGVNAIIQRTGARIALLVTEGFRDVLEMARLRLPTPWDFYGQRPAPLVPTGVGRARCASACGTTAASRNIRSLSLRSRAWSHGSTALAVEGVAICLLHSLRQPGPRAGAERRC